MLKLIQAGETALGPGFSQWFIEIQGSLEPAVRDQIRLLAIAYEINRQTTTWLFGSLRKQQIAMKHVQGQIRREKQNHKKKR